MRILPGLLIQKNNKIKNNINLLINPLPGSEIGIPLFFLEKLW